MFEEMFFAGSRAGEAAATGRAQKRLFARVNAHVRLQTARHRERLCADGAPPRPLLHVDELPVPQQRRAAVELLRAVLADLVALVRVAVPRVEVQRLRRDEHPTALVAHRLCPAGAVDDPSVRLEAPGLLECAAALVAGERTHVGVRPLV